MRIVVTGADGFVGQNLCAELGNRGYEQISKINRETSIGELEDALDHADFVFHLAGVNRPEDNSEYMEGNAGFTSNIIEILEVRKNYPPILFTSSVQAEMDNAYGQSKKASEVLLSDYSKKSMASVYIYRLPNLFGKWSKPNYNSVVATWCHNIAHDLPITIDDPDHTLRLAYIDDVVDSFLNVLESNESQNSDVYKLSVEPVHHISLGKLADLIQSFRDLRATRMIPDMSDKLIKSLYSTYLSYLPEDGFKYPLMTHEDHRGSFTEFIRTINGGQVSINISKPGISKGNHWHHTKNEKFLVVSGYGRIRFRNINSNKIISYEVSGEKLEVVDIPVGYTHEISNMGDSDLITIMWVNENYNSMVPDTYALMVEKEISNAE